METDRLLGSGTTIGSVQSQSGGSNASSAIDSSSPSHTHTSSNNNNTNTNPNYNSSNSGADRSAGMHPQSSSMRRIASGGEQFFAIHSSSSLSGSGKRIKSESMASGKATDAGSSNSATLDEKGKLKRNNSFQSFMSVAGASSSALHRKQGTSKPKEEDLPEIKSLKGYTRSVARTTLYCILALATGGLSLLFFRWYPIFWLKATHRRCRTFAEADYVLAENRETGWGVEQVRTLILDNESVGFMGTAAKPLEGDGNSLDSYHNDQEPILMSHRDRPSKASVVMRYFLHRMLRYALDTTTGEFAIIGNLPTLEMERLTDHSIKGLDTATCNRKVLLFGPNQIDVEVKSYFRLLIEEALNPFYMFQAFSIAVWCSEEYYYYAACIFFVSVISIGITLVETKKNQTNLRNMALLKDSVQVVRNGLTTTVAADSIVPGDIMVIPSSGMVLPCDALLLSGKCIVNESMLTGESVPVTKSAYLSNEEKQAIYDPDEDKKHTMYCGTQIIQTRQHSGNNVIAMAVRTGFYTAKGNLIRSILFPKPSKFKFYREALRFVLFLASLAFLGFIYSLVLFVDRKVDPSLAIIRAFDLVTVVVPPALPAAMTAGTVYAMHRLKEGLVYCISPPRVNVCGKIKMICFDKTGTLTEDGLDVWGFVPASDRNFGEPCHDLSELTYKDAVSALASCHSLTTVQGEMIGDPVDVKMFQATKWVLEEPGEETERYDSLVPTIVRPAGALPSLMKPTEPNYISSSPEEIGIVRQFHFSSHLQRMSVIVNHLHHRRMHAYVKGSPEMIRDLCDASSIPSDYASVLSKYTHEGFRVLALAGRSLPDINYLKSQRMKREEVESQLIFYGLLVMQNRLKKETTPVIRELIFRGNIRCAMVTGDNPLTAISVARECCLVDQDKHVFLGELSDGKVCWTHIDNANYFLDEKKLVPISDALSAANGHQNGEIRRANRSGSSRNSINSDELNEDEEKESHRKNGKFARGSKKSAKKDLYTDIMKYDPATDNPNYELAVTGKAFEFIRKHEPDVLKRLLIRGVVFARMSPEHKTELVEELQELGYIVAFCGDGANDCGALKAAHVGVSLSEAEASVAAPFTYKRATIECMPFVVREGRGALMTSFSMFKFMALYSFIQFTTILILRYIGSNLGDQQYLYFDLLIILTVALVMGRTGPADVLVPTRPPGSLMSPTILSSLVAQIILVIVVQSSSYFWLQSNSWFTPVQPDDTGNTIECYENVFLFYVSGYQYILIAICFSIGYPFRKPMYTNYIFTGLILVLIALHTYVVMDPANWIIDVLELFPMQTRPKLVAVLIGFTNLLVCYCLEAFLFASFAKVMFRFIFRKKDYKNQYKLIARQMAYDRNMVVQVHSGVE